MSKLQDFFATFSLLYLMVLADSHTISKSIDNNNKLDNNIFESIHDIDRLINPKTRKDRQHKYKLYYSKDEDVVLPDNLKETKPYTELEKSNAKNQLQTLKTTTEHAKHHKSPKRRVGGFWRKLRGKDKKKHSNKHDSFDRNRRTSHHKKEPQKYSTNRSPRIKGRRKNRKQFSLRLPEIKVTKRDVSGLFSTRPYSDTPQNQLQMGITPQVDNMLNSEYRTKTIQPFAVTFARVEVADNKSCLQGQLESINSKISDLKERYGESSLKVYQPSNTGSSSADNAETKETVTTTNPDYQGTAQIELMLNDMKARARHMVSFQKLLVTDLISSSVTEATFNSYPIFTRFGKLAPVSGFNTFASTNDSDHFTKTTVTSTKSDEFNLYDSIFSANTKPHYLVARSIKEDTMTIAQNVEDMLQRELKNIYNKVKHKVSSDFRKEIHTAKTTAKESFRKLSSKLVSKCKTANATRSTAPSTSTCPPKCRTTPCKSSKLKKKEHSSSSTATTTAPRIKKKDDTKKDKFSEDAYTPASVYKQTYDDYMMLTLFEQILSKTHEDNAKKMLATTEFPIFPKIKRETFRLSKRNPETLTDVKLREVIQNLYDDGGNMPDYDYIDPLANVSSTERTSAVNNYNDDYLLDPSATTDNSADYSMVEINIKNKVTTPPPIEADHVGHVSHAAAVADNTAAVSDSTAFDTSYEGLSSKISYNEFVNGYKHYLNFQKDQNNQNFSNLIKYQAHRHHSVDDIGKYILSKIPPLPSYNKNKREQRFSDDSENNMDYQEITTKNDDSWFRKHFYLFFDNGPPKKYHTSETVELKSPSTEPKLYMMTEKTLGIVPQDQIFIRIGSDSDARKAKHAQEISLDDLSQVLDSIKDKQTGDTLSKAKPNTQNNTFNSIDNYNITDDATSQDKSVFSKLFAGKRRNAPKKEIETTEYFPNYMFAVSTCGRLRRSITKQNLENTIMADLINKDIEEKASTGTKEVLANAVQFSNSETNKYGYVDIDLVPRQTAIVKLRDNAKKSRFKNFFKKFNFKKKKAINPKPKRSCPQNRRMERFNPIKKLKSMFNCKEVKEKQELAPDRLGNPDYDMDSHLNNYKPVKFAKPLSVEDMQKQIPNISDIYFEESKESTTKLSSNYLHLDDKDQDFLYNYHPSSSSSKPQPSVTTQTNPDTQTMTTSPRTNATQELSAPLSSTAIISLPKQSTTKKPEIPPCNVMTVNVKTMTPSTTTLTTTESSSLFPIDDMIFVLDNTQNKKKKDPDNFPKVTTVYYPSHMRQTGKYEYKKNVLPSLPPKSSLEELLIRGKLTRIAKFPIRKRLCKKRRHDYSELVDQGKDYLYRHDLESNNNYPERRKSFKGNTLRKLHHPQVGKAKDKYNKSRNTDYFNDLLLWHNDILNRDTVTNPFWENILMTVQSDTDNIYTTPSMNSLLIGLKEINDYLDLGDNVTRSALIISPNRSLNMGSKDHVKVRHVKNHMNDQGIIRSVAMDDNTLLTVKDMIIKGEAKYYQYNKPTKIATKLNSDDFIMKLNKLNVNNDDKKKERVQFKRKDDRKFFPPPSNNSEPSIIVDTTILAYDDDVDSVTKGLEIKKQSRNSKISFNATPKNKLNHSTLLKTNKPPLQYYTTPLPMKSHDFNKFLKENQMDVDFVMSPMLDLPTIRTDDPTLNKKKGPKCNNISTTTTQSALDMLSVAEYNDDTKPEKGFTQRLGSKIGNFTKALGKSVKFTTNKPKLKSKPQLKSKPKPKNKTQTNQSLTNNKITDWEDEFDRYKRYRQLILPTNAAPVKHNKATENANYYSIFKKKMKERLFDKKATGLPKDDLRVDHPTTEYLSVDPHSKEVEITIIDFDDIEKMTTRQPFTAVTFPALTRENIDAFSSFGAKTTDTTVISTEPKQKEKEMHNELLYKDILKERLTTATATTECPLDLTKSTEYVDPIVNDREAVISSKPILNRFPFEKMPIYPSVLRKVPHAKYFNSFPKRVHISSHHYKYDVIYDDSKRTGKTSSVEWPRFRPQHSTETPSTVMRAVKLTHKRTSTIWWREATHKIRKHSTFLERKPMSVGGSNESSWYFKTPIILTTLDVTADDSGKRTDKPFPSAKIYTALVTKNPHEKTFTSAVNKTTEVSLSEHTEPISDIEDVVTMLDRPDMGVTISYIDDAVTLSAMRSQFFTTDIFKGKPVEMGLYETVYPAKPPTKPAPKPATKPATKPVKKPATKPVTKPATKHATTPQPGSLVYNLKQLKPTTNSSKPTKDKMILPSCHEKDRQRRLFKFSALLQNTFKGLMKNFSATTKRTNATSHMNNMTHNQKFKPKRSFISFHDSDNETTQAPNKTFTMAMAPDAGHYKEGFCISLKPDCSTDLMPPPQDESEDVTPASFLPQKYKSNHEISDCEVYFEPETYNDQLYYEGEPLKCRNTTQSYKGSENVFHCDVKREAQQNTFTAKDVAALEVIVDLMKNTLSYEDNLPNTVGLSAPILQSSTTKPINANGSTNSIQVHIAIPFDFKDGKKRSPSVPGSVRVRKVFSAKMSTPVDLEYQVHSFEGAIAPTSTKPSTSINSTDGSLSPGMYLLIDKPKDGFALKPVLGQINLSDLRARQAATGTTVSMTESKPTDNREETTSLKSLARVTLSKEFVAAVNQQLIEMYENISRVNKDVNNKNTRPARSVWKSRKLKEKKEGRKINANKYIVKRRIDWEAIKTFFGHDRVCNCKCKSNKTMCRACAASDAVIDELIFEFDNIGQYMADHCTEIQTFFWMNPIGGQRLRESVNKIDKSLSDYYKRVKGKCRGRLCKTFATCSKRQFTKIAKTKKEDSMARLVNDLAVLAEDLNKTISLKACYNDKLKKKGDKFLDLMNHCIMTKRLNKRSDPNNPNTTPKKLIKNVYSLDNINVNIICNPESSTTRTYEHVLSEMITPQENPPIDENLLDFDLEETKENKRKGFKKLFPRKSKKSKLLSYFEFNKGSKTINKRQVDNQVATPLISDGGGAFWYDYLKSGTNEPRLARGSIKDAPNIEIAVVQKGVTTGANLTAITSNNDLAINTIDMTVQTAPERNQSDIEITTDSLSRNINQMLQLFESLQDVDALNNNSNQINMTLTTETVIDKAVSQDKAVLQDKPVSEQKPKEQSLTIVDKVKQKMDKKWSKDKPTTYTVPQKTEPKSNSTLDQKFEDVTSIKIRIKSVNQTTASETTNATTDDVFIITQKLSGDVTTFETTTEMTPVTDKTVATTHSVEKNNTQVTTIVPKSYDKSESTKMFGNKAVTKLGFIKKLKAATMLIFKKEQTSQTPKQTTETPAQTTTVPITESTSSASSIINIVSDVDVIEESAQITTPNPTILIINDYGNAIRSKDLNDKEEYRNLLLSIIQFETNNLNDEWDRVAYGGERHSDEMDIERTVPAAKVETVNPPMKLTPKTKPPAEVTYVGASDQDKTTKEPEGLLNKIASKMGIRVINNKKKVVKKAKIRELEKERKKGNFIRNRKMRINSYRQGNPTSPGSSIAEACHTRRPTKPSQICDIQATYDHIQKLQKLLPSKTFETLVRNITCYKYNNVDPIFTIHYKKKKGRRWDWIRKRRALKLHFNNRMKDEHNFDDDAFVVNFGDDSTDSFERFAKGDNGIYKMVKRKKRTANLEALQRGLRNIPTLMPADDEVFVMVGDSVTLDCGLHTPVRTCDGKFTWKTDRKRMLKQDNVYVDGVSVTIHNVEPRNVGTYTCSLDHIVRKNLRLNVLTVPSFDVVFLPVYKTDENCSYDDLKAIQRLGSLMSNETRCGKACSIRIDEPVCLRDKGTNSTLVRATTIISMTPRKLNCSLQCKRDIVSSLVMLCATNTATLSSIKVMLSIDGVNETLTPWKDFVRPVVTHTLRKKDTNGHHEYHKLVPLLTPGKVDVVVICPAGYYLLPIYKLCSSCPPNTSSKTGDNTCRSCPRGTRSEPGASKCHIVKPHLRRYDWWWYPPCGYVVACCGVLFGCTACVLLSVIVHVVSRDADHREKEDGDDEEHKILSSLPRVTLAHAQAARPLSPSRVILPRFFRPSLTSSRATDSQETRFELWKERNRPPPLPPIDFDP